MVSSVCRGSYPSMTPHASPSRKVLIDPQKDYFSPLQVETSVEYDLPAHIYPPKGSEPILMIHPAYSSAVRARSRAVITPSPTAMLATSGQARPLAPLQLANPQQQQQQQQGRRPRCMCGNPACNSKARHRAVPEPLAAAPPRSVSGHSARSVGSQSARSVSSQSVRSVQSVVSHNTPTRPTQPMLHPQQQQQQQQQQQLVWGAGGRCLGPCCNPRAAAMAPPQAEFVAPGLPPSLLARTPTRGTAGGSPKLRAARTRRGLSVASSVNLPDYLGSARPSRVAGTAVHVHPRPRALSTSMGALAATPAPPMAHHHMAMGASLTTSLDLARAHALTPHSMQPPMTQPTASLLHTVGLSRDSGCSVGAEPSGEWPQDRTRGLVDSGFCTPVDLTDEFVSDTLSLGGGGGWKEPSTPMSSMTSTSSSGVHTSILPGAPHHYLPQPLWNLAY